MVFSSSSSNEVSCFQIGDNVVLLQLQSTHQLAMVPDNSAQKCSPELVDYRFVRCCHLINILPNCTFQKLLFEREDRPVLRCLLRP